MPNDLLEAALTYAQRGWYVLPCQPKDKQPLTPHGAKQATCDAATIRGWWRRWPAANIGLACGPSGLEVLDVDAAHDGMDSLRELRAELGAGLLETVTCETGGGGLHLYFARGPNGAHLGNSTGKLGPGLDTRGAGGYVIAPPSVHPSGGVYGWAYGCGPDERALLEAPPALAARLKPSTTAGGGMPAAGGAQAGAAASGAAEAVIPLGQRNARLTSLAGSLRRQDVGQQTLLQVLLEQNARRCQPPLPEAEVQRIAASVARYPAAVAPLPDEPLTDLGNARRLVRLCGQDLRHVPTWGWMYWHGRHWQRDDCGHVIECAKQVALSLYDEASACQAVVSAATERARQAAAAGDRERQRQAREECTRLGQRAEALRHWALKSQDWSRLRDMTQAAASDPALQARPEQFDTQPWLLNCANGTLDLHTGELRPHCRADLLTKLCPLSYDPQAACPAWERFQLQIAGGDAQLAAFKQRAYGYALSGDTTEQAFFILHGSGANGKSTETGLIREALGADYAGQTAPETLLHRERGGQIPNDIAALRGLRLVTAAETDAGRRLDEGKLKQMTGSDPLTARFLNHEFFSFLPEFKVFLAVNHKPEIRGTDHGIWRRVHLIPYPYTVPEAARDKRLPDRLRAELPGILAWLVRGCQQWQQQGLGTSPAVVRATAAYRAEQDLLADFIDARCIRNKAARVGKGELYLAYTAWCEAEHDTPLSKRTFGDKLREREISEERTGKARAWVWVGLGLLAEGTPPPFAPPEADIADIADTESGNFSRNEAGGSFKGQTPKSMSALSAMSAGRVPTEIVQPEDATSFQREMVQRHEAGEDLPP